VPEELHDTTSAKNIENNTHGITKHCDHVEQTATRMMNHRNEVDVEEKQVWFEL